MADDVAQRQTEARGGLSMLALTYTGSNALEWREAPEPRLSSEKAALVPPVAVATCDLDALIITGASPFAT
jgi:alcohol dehydrogenase